MKGILALFGVVALTAVIAGSATAAPGPLYPIPDDQAIRGHPPAMADSSGVLRPDDRAQHGVGAVPASTQPQSPAIRIDRFDWLDAGIGAAAVGLGLLVVASSAVVHRRRRQSCSTRRT